MGDLSWLKYRDVHSSLEITVPSCVHLERHFVDINMNGTVPHGGPVCTDGVEIGSAIVVCCIRLLGYVSNRLVEALCTIVPLLFAGVAFSVTG